MFYYSIAVAKVVLRCGAESERREVGIPAACLSLSYGVESRESVRDPK